MNKIKMFIFMMMAVGVTGIFISECKSVTTDDGFHNGKKIERVMGSSEVTDGDLKGTFGYADYVAVVKIQSEDTTNYKNVTQTETVKFGIPYTKYKVKVCENLRGELPKDKEITVSKAGGLSIDGKCYYVDEGDVLPEEGRYYIMSFCVQQDGSLLASGADTTIAIRHSVLGTQNIDRYRKACKDCVIKKRDRYTYRR